MTTEINELKQRISNLESAVEGLLEIAVITSQTVTDNRSKCYYCECGNNITEMKEDCKNKDCKHGLCNE